jgi:uncharacterized protein DUF4430
LTRRRTLRLATTIATAVVVAGCGLGAGRGTSDVGVVVTRDFGTHVMRSLVQAQVPGSETVVQLLERHFRLGLAYSGDFVTSIDGIGDSGSHVNWFYYVNGIEAPMGAATTGLHHGDRIWWDIHDWVDTDSIPAVVGSFPQPFLSGLGGKHYPTIVDCAADAAAACAIVKRSLQAAGITPGSGREGIKILVGSYDALGSAAAPLAGGPKASGVYARFIDDGNALALLDPAGATVRRLAAAAGLIAATVPGSGSLPIWFITGTDQAGVDAAARELTISRLRDHFALVADGDEALPVPLDPAS